MRSAGMAMGRSRGIGARGSIFTVGRFAKQVMSRIMEGRLSDPCVIILGMHRSGTSLLAGSLESAGLNLGDVNHAAPFNRKGNKENEAIRSFHDEMLVRNGVAWNAPPRGQIRWTSHDEERASSLIEPFLRAGRPWGFKDPRTIWMVQGWLGILPRPHLLGVFRHPTLVVRSLIARTGNLAIGPDEALRLWCCYNAELVRLQRRHVFPLLHFNPEGVLDEDYISALTSIAGSLGLSGPIDRFFDNELVHHSESSHIGTRNARHLYVRLIELARSWQ